jgi:hypothetical protein
LITLPYENGTDTNLKKSTLAILFLLISLLAWAQVPSADSLDLPLELDFIPTGGFYHESVEVELVAPQGKIYYTVDGSKPTSRSKPYKGPIELKETTVIRAVAISDDKTSLLLGNTYFVDEPDTDFPVVSLGISPYLLFDPYQGIFMQGSRAVDSLWQKPGANFWTRREFPLHVEMYEQDGRCVYNNLSGFRLFGGMSRLFPQKSLALVARNRYGEKRFDYPIFGKEGPDKFKYLVLRNSGSDFGKSHIRDILMTRLVDGFDLDKQAARPSHVYINGTYWGIFNIREKVNRYFVAAHNDVDKDSLDLIEHRQTLKRGTKREYLRFIEFVEQNDLSEQRNYDYVASKMEIENYMDHQIAQIYFDNQDAGGNIKFWRPQTEDGRWRWILFDTDWGFGLHQHDAYKNNSLAFHTQEDGPSWPNPPWSTLLLRRLLDNPGFRSQFVNRFADRLNTAFAPEKVLEVFDSINQTYAAEMPRHLERWRLSERKWKSHLNRIRTFAAERPMYVRMHMMDKFNTGAQRNLQVSTSTGGSVVINNNLRIRSDKDFDGIYFENYPIHIRAVPDYGYRFARWEGITLEDNQRSFDLQLRKHQYVFRAVFEPFAHPLLGQVVINEVAPLNKKSGDWIEIYNHTKKRVTLTDWVITDLKNEWTLPQATIDPNDYLVICRDSTKFFSAFPNAYNVVTGLGFGIHKRKETLALFSRLGAVVDSISYEVPPSDSAFTLSLLLPELDNADPENWAVRFGEGSPNLPNPYYLESTIRSTQELWLQMGLAATVLVLCILLLVLRSKGHI